PFALGLSSHWVYVEDVDDGCIPDMDLLASGSNAHIIYENKMLEDFANWGYLESSIVDIGFSANWKKIGWEACIPYDSSIAFYWRASDHIAGFDTIRWNGPIWGNSLVSPDSANIYGIGQYFQYRVEFFYTSDDIAVLHKFRAEYDTLMHSLEIELITPPEDVLIACVDQEILFSVERDTFCKIDSANTFLIIDSTDTFTLDSLWLSIDSLIRFEPDSAYWKSGHHWFQLHLEDDCGNIYDSLYSATFDLDPPTAQMTEPPIGEPNERENIPPDAFTYDLQQDIKIHFWDDIGNVDIDSIMANIDGYEIPVSAIQMLGDTLFFAPENFNIRFSPGETVEVFLRLCDTPDWCAPNCADFRWFFCLVPQENCARTPNPFTPNGDGKNDFAQFLFPDIGYQNAKIYIYDLRNILVKKIDVPAGDRAKVLSRWYGYDNSGAPVPEGLYLYIIETNDEIVCDGTTTLAR
ncbi:hypothetical protein DRQ26_04480, partial [bacterium]